MKTKFVSLRTKILLILVIFSACILLVVGLLIPSISKKYLLEERKKRLLEQQTIVTQMLQQLTNRSAFPENQEEPDLSFLKDQQFLKFIDLSARSSEMTIWICLSSDDDTNLTIMQFGKVNKNEIGGYSTMNLTAVEFQTLKSMFLNNSNSFATNAFPSVFHNDTLTLSFTNSFQSFKPKDLNNEMNQDSILILIHSGMEDDYVLINIFLIILFIIVILFFIAIYGFVFYISSHVIDPVKQLQKLSETTKRGDFSQEIKIQTNDEIGQLAASYNSMVKELSSIETIQSDFITNISHDFRSPLTSIKGYVEAILDGTIDSDNQNKYLQIVLDETNRLTKMANNVVDLSKIQSGQIEVHPSTFDINETIVRLALGFEKRVEERQIEISFNFTNDHLKCFADEALIERVVYNLLDNAIKFTPQKGKIVVETSIVARKAYISVSDTGLGISDEALPHIFERFHKGDKSRGKDRQGAGLGLAIVKQIINAHKEEIAVTSEVGEGSVFSFTLPLE